LGLSFGDLLSNQHTAILPGSLPNTFWSWIRW